MSVRCSMVKEFEFRGSRFKVDCSEDGPYDATWFSFVDESEVRDRWWSPGPGDCVLDVGAAFGSYTLTALAAGASTVFAWSPHPMSHPTEAERLEESLRLNGWEDRCRVSCSGFWDKGGHSRVAHHQRQAQLLMQEVQEVTVRLMVGSSQGALPGQEVRALSVASASGRPMDDYKSALAKAKKDDLPELFKRIELENKSLASWMKAKLIPFRARAEKAREVMDRIEDRIFSVELYAGLVESVVRVRDGEPAPVDEKVRLMQRRCYMDEECLASYRTGGMDFRDIESFDSWLSEDENLERLMPFPRCVVAFRVRRGAKEREAVDFSDFVRFARFEKEDQKTFLYLRNGGQLYRLSTGIEFDEKLFPDLGAQSVDRGKLWIKRWGDEIISDHERQGMVEEEARRREEAAKLPKEDRWRILGHGHERSDDYVPLNPDTVLYDHGVGLMEKDVKKHNRLVLVLQGVLDRSPVFHPHPPWSLWTAAGFRSALELVYDSSRALAPAERPDFESYRSGLNKSISAGTNTVGQEDRWELREGAKEAARYDRARVRSDYRPTRARPYGDPGPGLVARVVRRTKAGECVFNWERKRNTYRGWRDDEPVRESLSVKTCHLLNVDAYSPGDYKQFFNDPRTRAEYLKWAPLLLAAEEFHAGSRSGLPEKKCLICGSVGKGAAGRHNCKRGSSSYVDADSATTPEQVKRALADAEESDRRFASHPAFRSKPQPEEHLQVEEDLQADEDE